MKNEQNRKFFNIIFVLFIAVFVFTGDSLALEFLDDFGEKTGLKDVRKRLEMGPLSLHPFVRQQMSYDSNVFLEPDDEKEDVIWTTTPGIIADLKFDDHLIEASYKCDFENFTKFSSQNDQNQRFDTLLDLHFPDWYVNNTYRLEQTSSRAGTTFTQRIGRLENTVNTSVGYKWNQLTLEADYHLFHRRYSSKTYQQYDYHVNVVGTTLFLDLTKKTQAFVEYAHGFIDYRTNQNRDGNFDRVRGGVRGKILPRLTAIAKLGWESRRYHGDNEPGFNSFSAEVSARQQFTSRTAVEIGYYRGPEEATFLDNSFFTQDRLFTRIEQKFFRSVLFVADLGFTNQRYEQATLVGRDWGTRRDRIYLTNVFLKYDFRDWWDFTVGYKFKWRDSKFNAFDYKDHLFYVNTGIHL